MIALGYNLRLIGRLYSNYGCGSRLSWSRLQVPFKLALFLGFKKIGIIRNWRVPLCYNGHRHVWTIRHRSDLSVLDEIFVRQEYGVPIAEPRVIFDLGANIGGASVYFAQRWPRAQIFAFEPNPQIFERLLKNTTRYPNIRCYPFAASGLDEEVRFNIDCDHLGSSIAGAAEGGVAITVESKSLKSMARLVDQKNIDLLKFDIEGAEESLFSDRWFEKHVGFMIGEVHKAKMSINREQFLAQFDQFDIEITHEDDRYIIMNARART